MPLQLSFFVRLFLVGVVGIALLEKGWGGKLSPIYEIPEEEYDTLTTLQPSYENVPQKNRPLPLPPKESGQSGRTNENGRQEGYNTPNPIPRAVGSTLTDPRFNLPSDAFQEKTPKTILSEKKSENSISSSSLPLSSSNFITAEVKEEQRERARHILSSTINALKGQPSGLAELEKKVSERLITLFSQGLQKKQKMEDFKQEVHDYFNQSQLSRSLTPELCRALFEQIEADFASAKQPISQRFQHPLAPRVLSTNTLADLYLASIENPSHNGTHATLRRHAAQVLKKNTSKLGKVTKQKMVKRANPGFFTTKATKDQRREILLDYIVHQAQPTEKKGLIEAIKKKGSWPEKEMSRLKKKNKQLAEAVRQIEE